MRITGKLLEERERDRSAAARNEPEKNEFRLKIQRTTERGTERERREMRMRSDECEARDGLQSDINRRQRAAGYIYVCARFRRE